MAKIEINRRLYWIYANYRDCQKRKHCWPCWNYANYRDGLNKFTGGHIEFMLIIEMAKIEINRRLYWIYANCRGGQNRN